ncbi:MAG: hypothetical protein LBG59_05315 [Candidatus Peribacteria bacterium]|nr:hypothetical protein [Candidatus Peribacteria bacterium]
MLELLHTLKPHRELSEGMIALIDAGFMDSDTLTNLLFMITAVIKSLPEGEEKNQLKEQLDTIKESLKKAE